MSLQPPTPDLALIPYSCRAEALADLGQFFVVATAHMLPIYFPVFHQILLRGAEKPFTSPDIGFEFQSTATLEQLRDAMREVIDSHVMLQTLRAVPFSENSLGRDFDLE